MTGSTIGALICCEVDPCSCADSLRTSRPKPPSRVGIAYDLYVCSPGGDCAVSAGKMCDWITFSKGSRMPLS